MSYVFTFGKYKGRRIGDVPDGYLHWIRDSWDMIPEPLATALWAELARRGDRPPSKEPEVVLPLAPCPDGALAREMVKAGFRSLARRYHPDAGGDHETMIMVGEVSEWFTGVLDVAVGVGGGSR